ncbi:malonyl CoA-acyl carrier protein transacylase [Iodidimonas muriae]|uniref:Malonyl CoA-acyl carrier protein transacylase n=1 Tax=Iodidimonas muriae TaxID=261467 RepID=A0ABQ2LEB1_9PROT|nr:ACP S-malonyltransferase [Iodidimonas muriae]GER07044.1 malonyl CoA-acyl carrier protein transacylase [Kordiimonadales bacterium JCM 17843]GGO13232.1 malonyl CoA-acyl carrier protein transacylase [Iodidimonas muriae]
MTRAVLFPGQGSQYVGMGKSLAEVYPVARAVFEEVNDALGQNLSRLMFEGDEAELRLTENAQPALMAASMAVVRVLADGGVAISDCASHVAGHSLGEYSALCAAGALSLTDAARLLKHRGQAMQRAVPLNEGAMAAILGLEIDSVEEVVKEAATDDQVCACANDNAPGQVVISGHTAAVEAAIALAKERGAKRGLLLPVSAPFHCSLMAPAADEMREALKTASIASPVVPVITNITAAPETDPEALRRLLVEQVTGRVRWRETVLAFSGLGIDQMVELGAGKVLSGLVKRIDRSIATANIQDPSDLDAFIATL